MIKIKYRRKDNRYTNYFKNFKYFYNKIKELDSTKLNSIAKTFLQYCEIIEIKSWNVEQAIAMFNSLNSDGMPLSDADIIVSNLYANIKEDERDIFKGKWERMQDQIKDLENNKITDIDNILNQYMYYKRTINGDTKNLSGNIDITVPGIRRYFTEINSEILKKPNDMIKELSNLVSMWGSISDRTLVKILLKINSNSKLFLASYLFGFTEKDIDLDKIDEIVKCLIKLFVILEIGEGQYSSQKFRTFLFKEEVKFAKKNIGSEEIIEDFRMHINQNWEENEINELIKDYDKNALLPLNEYLFSLEKKSDFELKLGYDIEHIMPYSNKYHKSIMQDLKIDSEEEFESYVNKIGNKILLEEEINRGIGDNWFRDKLSINNELKNGYSKSVYPIAKDLVDKYKNVSHPIWTKEDIVEATKKASNRICKFVFG